MAISPECFDCFRWELQNWKEQSFTLTIGTESITHLLKSNFKRSKCKWRHLCHAFAKKGTFFWTCPPASFLYKYWTARKEDNNSIFTIGLPTKTTFDGCMAK